MSTLNDRLAGVSDGLGRKAPARFATVGPITLSGLQAVDGPAVTREGDRVVVWKQSDKTQNGIYNASSGPWTRTLDFDGARDVISGTGVAVAEGASYAGYELFASVPLGFRFGVSPITFTLSNRTLNELSVTSFGAKLDGTDDTAALQEARAAASLDGSILVPPGQWERTADPTAGSASPVLWRMSGNKFGASSAPVIGVGSDTVENYFNGTKYIGRHNSTTTTGPVVRIDGEINHTNGDRANISILEVNATNGKPSAPGAAQPAFPWAILGRVYTYSGNHESTAIYAQNLKKAPGGGIFGFVSEARDDSGQSSGTAGPVVSAEIDLTANGADNDTSSTPYGNRIMLDMVIAQSDTIGGDGGKNQVGTVMRIGARPNEGSIKTVFRSINATPVSDCVLDTTGFVLQGVAVAVKLAPGQKIAFDGRSNDGGYSRTLEVAGGLLVYTGPSGVAFSVDDAGDFSSAGKGTFGLGLNIPDVPAPTSTTDLRGSIGDVIFTGAYAYRKTTAGWLRSAVFTSF